MGDKIENWRTIKTDDPCFINFSLGDLANEIDNNFTLYFLESTNFIELNSSNGSNMYSQKRYILLSGSK